MARQEYWIGSHGPFIYDDVDVYGDGITPHTALRGAKGHISEDPTDDEDIVNKKYVDTRHKEVFKIGDIFMNADGIDPGIKHGYGVWVLLGHGTLTLT